MVPKPAPAKCQAKFEADSLYGGLKDGDFGDGALIPTDVEGYGFKLKYKLHDKITLGGTALIFERMESQVPVDGDRNDGEVYQVDLIYKF